MSIETAVATLAPGASYTSRSIGDQVPGSDATATFEDFARLGLYPIGRYWAHPQFDEPGVYLPLDVPEPSNGTSALWFVITTPRARFWQPRRVWQRSCAVTGLPA